MPLVDQPRDLLLGDDNDLVVTTDFQLSVGIDGVAQACRVAVQMFAEEWFLDLDVGIPYLQEILGHRRAVAIISAKAAFRRELRAVAGVFEVVSLDATFDSTTRTLTVSWVVATALGNTPVDTLSVTGA